MIWRGQVGHAPFWKWLSKMERWQGWIKLMDQTSPNSRGSVWTSQKKTCVAVHQKLSSLIQEIGFGGSGGIFIPSSSCRKEKQTWTFNGIVFRCQRWTGFVLLDYGPSHQKSHGAWEGCLSGYPQTLLSGLSVKFWGTGRKMLLDTMINDRFDIGIIPEGRNRLSETQETEWLEGSWCAFYAEKIFFHVEILIEFHFKTPKGRWGECKFIKH